MQRKTTHAVTKKNYITNPYHQKEGIKHHNKKGIKQFKIRFMSDKNIQTTQLNGFFGIEPWKNENANRTWERHFDIVRSRKSSKHQKPTNNFLLQSYDKSSKKASTKEKN